MIGSPLQRQAELFRAALDVERRVQRGLVGRAFGPLDAEFDLLEESGAMLRGQAESLDMPPRRSSRRRC